MSLVCRFHVAPVKKYATFAIASAPPRPTFPCEAFSGTVRSASAFARANAPS